MTIRDVEIQLKDQFDRKRDKHQAFRAVITDSAGNNSGSGDVWFNENERKVYYRELGSGPVSVALCDRIEPEIGLGVFIQFDELSRQHEVLRDDPAQRGTTSNRRSYLITVKSDLERGGQQQLWIEDEMLQNLALNPNTGLTLDIGPGDYDYFGERKAFAGHEAFDISSSQPAGPTQHRLVGLYLDGNNTLQSVDGTITTTDVAAVEPTWPVNAFRLFTVDLNDTQTTISLREDVKSRKILWGETRGGFPTPGNIVLITGSNRIDHNDISEAIADAVDGDTILLGSGAFSETSITTDKGLTLIGQGRDATTLAFSGTTGLTINGTGKSVDLRHLKVETIRLGSCDSLVVDDGATVNLFNSTISASRTILGAGTIRAAYLGTTGSGGTLNATDTEFLAQQGSTANYGIYIDNNASSIVSLTGCHADIAVFTGDAINIQNGTMDLKSTSVDGGLNAVGGTVSGYYYDEDSGLLHILSGDGGIEMEERASDPSAPGSGKWPLYFKSDGLYILEDTGTARGPIPGAWTTFTPTVTQSSSVTVTVTYAEYKLVDDMCTVRFRLVVTGSGTAGNAIVIGSIPAAAQALNPSSTAVIGTGLVLNSATAFYTGAMVAVGASDFRFYGHSAVDATDYVGISPSFALASGDVLAGSLVYKV